MFMISPLYPLYPSLVFLRVVIILTSWLITNFYIVAQNEIDFYEQGLEAIEEKDYESAKQALFKAVQLQPNFPEAFLALGQVFEAFGDEETALKSYGRAISQDKQLFEAYLNYGAIIMARNDPRTAWRVYSRVIELDPKNIEAYMRRAAVLLPFVPFLALLDYDKAIEYIEEQKSKENRALLASAYASRGKANFLLWRWEDAENDYKEALSQNRRDGLAYVGLARSQLRQQKYTKARRTFLQAMRYESENPYVYAGLGAIATTLQRQEQAQEYLEQAFIRSTEIAELHWLKAQFEEYFGTLEAAETDYNSSVQLAPKDFEVYLLRGAFYQRQSRYQEALKDYNKGISLLNGNLFKTREGETLDETELLLLFQYRGDVQLLMDQPEAAIRDYETLLKRKVENVDVFTHLAVAQAALGQYEEALQSCETAISLAPKQGLPAAKPYYYQSQIYANLEQYDRAEESVSTALRYQPENPDYLYSLALYQYEQDSYAKVLKTLKKFTRLYYEDGEIYSLRAKANFQLGFMQPALADAEAALESEPQNFSLHVLKASVYREQGEDELALESYQAALAIMPDSVDLYLSRSELYQKLGKPDLALEDINKALNLEPESSHIVFQKGILLALNDDLDAAIDWVSQAIELEPERLEYRESRADMAIRLGRYNEAQEDIEYILQNDADHSQGLYLSGIMSYYQGEYKLAEKRLSKAYRENPKDMFRSFNYAQVLVTNGKTGKAKTLFNKLLRSEQSKAEGLYGVALIALYNKSYAQAIDLFNEAIESVDKPIANAYIGRGSTYLKLLDYNSALEDFKYYLAQYGDHYQVWRFLGEAQRNLGDLDPAYKSFEKALSYNELDAGSYYGKGMILLSKKSFDLALADFERAIELDQNQALFYLGRALVKQAKGDLQGALADSNIALRQDKSLAEAYKVQVAVYTELQDERKARQSPKPILPL